MRRPYCSLERSRVSIGWRRRASSAKSIATAKALTSLLLGLAACAWVNFDAGAASASCKDCKADRGLTVREQIKADRAREDMGRPGVVSLVVFPSDIIIW